MFFLLIFLFIVSNLSAQVNIENLRGKDGVDGNVRFSLNGQIGNVDAVYGDAAGNLSLHTDAGVYMAVAQGGIGFLSGRRFANSGVIHARSTLKWRPKWQPELFTQADYAKSRLLDERTLVGAGMRWVIADQGELHVALGSAMMWEREVLDIRSDDPHSELTSQVRASHYVNAVWEAKAILSLTAYYQVAISDWRDARILGACEMNTQLFGPIEQTTALNFRIDTKPPLGVQKYDLKSSTSFGISF